MKNKNSKNKIISKIWGFMNKSPILSGVIISILAIVGSQFMKIYTYIYWLPYFRFFKIPMYYFDIVIFDRYTIICKIILIILIMIMIFSVIEFIEKRFRIKQKFGLGKLLLLEVVILYGNLLLKMSIHNFEKIDILNYIEWVIVLIILKNMCSFLMLKIKLRKMFFSIIFGIAFILLGTGGIMYMYGDNNVINYLYSPLKVIDDNKLVLLETTDKYYIVPCAKREGGGINIYRDSYAFIDKNNYIIQRRYYDIYDEYNKNLN